MGFGRKCSAPRHRGGGKIGDRALHDRAQYRARSEDGGRVIPLEDNRPLPLFWSAATSLEARSLERVMEVPKFLRALFFPLPDGRGVRGWRRENHNGSVLLARPRRPVRRSAALFRFRRLRQRKSESPTPPGCAHIGGARLPLVGSPSRWRAA